MPGQNSRTTQQQSIRSEQQSTRRSNLLFSPLARRGFTVIELLVVISIMIILLAALAPAVFNVSEDSQLSAAKNAVQSGAQAARALATRKRASIVEIAAANDSGTALIFTPSGELRLAVNDQRARDSSSGTLEDARRNGFRDAPGRDYIELPRGVGVAGIVAPMSAGAVKAIVRPPFALRYDEQGGLVAGTVPGSVPDRTSYAFYDGDFDGQYEYASTRDENNDYELKDFDREGGDRNKWFIRKIGGTDLNVWKLPFEELETVIGVIIYSQGDMEDQNRDWDNGEAAQWLAEIDPETGNLKNGKLLLFSRHSGSGIQ